jgi:thioredoxin reductase (NADPH)
MDRPGATAPAVIETDVLVIGAGPVGLWQVFQLGLQGIATQVVDALPEPGGQCAELYPAKPIYDIPGVPVCSGQELVAQLLQQVRPFRPTWHLGQTVDTLVARADGRFDLRTSAGQVFIARAVFIAGGVGAFQPRQLQAPGADRLAATDLLYRLPPPATLAGRQVLVIGGEDGAVQAAVALADAPAAERPAAITLLHRRATLTAEPAALARLQAHQDAGRVRFIAGQVVGIDMQPDQPGRLAGVQLVDSEGQSQALPADALLVQLGISPKLGAIADWGLALERRQLQVDPARFETSLPGVYAVGDVVSYPGKKKLILCGFHEATLATFAALARLRPEAPTLLQYTTTSTLLQQRLGVAGRA